jgi:hypothetical protein
MTISGTVQFSGRFKYSEPVPYLDSSSNPFWISDVLEQMACSARKEDEYTLVADGDTAISFGSLPFGANVIIIKVMPNLGLPPTPGNPAGTLAVANPIIAKLTSAAGAASPIAIDGFLFLMSQSVPYTALSIARTPTVQTTVRVQLFSVGS